VCLPARNEAATVGEIVTRIAAHPLVDEVVVVDDHSRDATGDVAAAAGATVVRAAEVLAEHGDGPGKGQALWKAVASSNGDVVAFCDADLRDFQPHFVTGLLGPFLLDPSLGFLKAYYRRPTGDGSPRGGGRVTELVARPLLAMLFPELADVVQPLAGEFAARRDVFEALPFVEGYGVDIGLVIDAYRRCGLERLAQVDLGTRKHRNRPLDDLGPMATVVLMTMLRRAGIETPPEVLLDRIDLPVAPVRWAERPALVEVPEYKGRS